MKIIKMTNKIAVKIPFSGGEWGEGRISWPN
jgi:hypothetical protein